MVTPKRLSAKIQFSTFGWVSLALEIAELDTEMGNECFLVLRVDHLENDAGKSITKIILQILSELEILMVYLRNIKNFYNHVLNFLEFSIE